MFDFESLIYTINDNITTELCEEIIEKFEQDERKVSCNSVLGYFPELKNNNELHISNLEDWKDIDDKLAENLTVGLKSYINHLFRIYDDKMQFNYHTFNNLIDDGYTVERYSFEEYYNWHHDMKNNRIFGFMWFLSTMEAGEGGTIEFINGTKIRPKKRTLLFFPVSWLFLNRSNVMKVLRKKYIVSGFICQSTPENIKKIEEKNKEKNI